jgi:hypothetical protein
MEIEPLSSILFEAPSAIWNQIVVDSQIDVYSAKRAAVHEKLQQARLSQESELFSPT